MKKHRFKLYALFLAMSVPATVFSDIYKYTAPDGKIFYSDKPQKGYKLIIRQSVREPPKIRVEKSRPRPSKVTCDLDSFVSGVEVNTSGCNIELSTYNSPQPGGQCVSLIASAEMLNDYLSGSVYGCSSSQKNRARRAASAAISTLRRAQRR